MMIRTTPTATVPSAYKSSYTGTGGVIEAEALVAATAAVANKAINLDLIVLNMEILLQKSFFTSCGREEITSFKPITRRRNNRL